MKKFLKNGGIWAAVLAAAGAVLLILPGLLSDGGKKEAADTAEFYSETLEAKIEKLCTGLSGVNQVRVLVTLDGGSEYVYASNSEKKDSSSGTSSARDYLVVEKGSGEEPVVVSEIYPKIRGVAIVCTGGDDPAVKEKIVGLVSAALGISSNRISVAGGS